MARPGPEAAPQRALVDAGYLDRLELAIGGEVLAELLSDGAIELADRLGRLEHVAREGDRPAVAALAHDIVAVAGHMGLGALSAAAVELCRALREDDDDPAAGRLALLASSVIALGIPSIDALEKRCNGGVASA
ncbi:Hpt domain-containing protein [Limibaculum sp. FT325]|uniref:Hpt domain-containing protein n=1 Tax=Thermohalobaculum sediminis TaxID=2939436 RepID=UPI0020C1785B|nr:Hpt domain-containing protein [Limibaculum sediminis]MCL5776030.1 Hpt domain-containing protein [Limibaculum sediminis]